MNCDQVFDVLTRGPFPTGTACDPAVEAHLNVCPECRRLAEALRPALELFQEAVAPEESRDLPGYWTAVATDRKPPIVSQAGKREPASRTSMTSARASLTNKLAKNWSALTVWRMAAMLALGLTLGSFAQYRARFDSLSSPPSSAGIAPQEGAKIPRLTAAQHAQLVAALPAGCLLERAPTAAGDLARGLQMPTTADSGNLSYCSGCHSPNSDRKPIAAVAQIQHCQLCHND
jgi:hypothetical protein